MKRREWKAAHAQRERDREREEAEYNEWLASRGLPPSRPRRRPKEYWPLPLWAALLMRWVAGLVGIVGGLGLWLVVGLLIGADYSRGWIPPLATAAVFLLPVAGLFWLAFWMNSRAFAGHERAWRLF